MATPAWPHAFGERYTLPMPLWLYLAGAGAAVALSFIVMTLFVRHSAGWGECPGLNLFRRPAGRLIAHPWVLSGLRWLSAGLFLLLLAAGFWGNQSPTKNITPTMVWVIWWVGMAFVCSLAGDFWSLVNPWRILYTWAESVYGRIMRRDPKAYLWRYPGWLGFWPAAVFFLVFAWIELVWEGGEVPANISALAAGYSVVTWSGMLAFGKEKWLRCGEVFTVIFGLLARFSPTEVRVTAQSVCEACRSGGCAVGDEGGCLDCHECIDRAGPEALEWNLRPYAAGLLIHRPVPASMVAFVLLILATVTYDGFIETHLWKRFLEVVGAATSLRAGLIALEGMGVNLLYFFKSITLLVFPAVFLGAYYVFVGLMKIFAPGGLRDSAEGLAGYFVFSLVPIAIAYHLAHYLSYLLLAGQLVIPLASDPFGAGWDLFGTSGYRLRLDIMNARMVWFVAVGAIVAGHIISVVLGHLMAIRVFPDERTALRSQYPMMVLMIGYTMMSLWILAQPLVVKGPAG
jgi:hypothetical protein